MVGAEIIVVENMVMAPKSLQGKVGLFERDRERDLLWNFKLGHQRGSDDNDDRYDDRECRRCRIR